MRKLLLVGAAMVASAGVAQAQTQLVTNPVPGAGGAAPFANAQPEPAPGQIAVRLNGRLAFYYGFAANGDIHAGAHKLSTEGMKSYIRLYPGFDGVAANGLRYGVMSEIRQDNGAASNRLPGSSDGMAGTHMYWRRAYGYIGMPDYGRIQFGMGDGPVSAMGQIGQFGNIGTGTFCGDVATVYNMASSRWPFLGCSGNIYSTNKLVYYSPQFAGFDFGLGYEPGTNVSGGAANCTTANAGTGSCDWTSTSTDSNAVRRRRNMLDAAIRYRGTFNNVAIAAVGGYLSSGRVRDPYTSFQKWDGLSVGYGGMTVSFAGFTIGGALQGGANDGVSLRPVDGRDSFSWVVGATYQTGPMQVGVTYYESKAAGEWRYTSPSSVSRTRHDRAFEAAFNYNIAPGLRATVEYIWADSWQRGADLNAYRGGRQSGLTNQTLVGGFQLSW
jgi:hypothetical protein